MGGIPSNKQLLSVLDCEEKALEIGATLHGQTLENKPALFGSRGMRNKILNSAIQDEALRSALFQFVDVLPQLDSAQDIASHFRSYLKHHPIRGVWGKLMSLGQFPIAAWAVRNSVSNLARLFLIEENQSMLHRAVKEISQIPASITVDAVGEAVLSEAEADNYVARNLNLINWLAEAGATPNLSIKFSALTSRFAPLDEEGTKSRIFSRLETLMTEIQRHNATLTIDMEQYEYKPLLIKLFKQLVEAYRSDNWLPAIALQAYLPDTEQDLRNLVNWARNNARRISVRLVKGAYWDTEVALAAQRHWPIPVFLNKVETDAHYEKLTLLLFDNHDIIYPAIAGHNLRSMAHALAAAQVRGMATTDWEIQMLYGMAEPLRQALSSYGAQLRIYLPTGELITGIAYLIRRLLENTAATSILRQTYHENIGLNELLADPKAQTPLESPTVNPQHFKNAPFTDFSLAHRQEKFGNALTKVTKALGQEYPLPFTLDKASDCYTAVNPGRLDQTLGSVKLAGLEEAELAISQASKAFPAWRDTSVERRVELCLRAANLVEQQRHELAAWEVLEVGKSWREADADVAEAIDYLRFYATQMKQFGGWHPTINFPGENNYTRYEPRGVAVIISPWNFPLAILTGMAVGALVTGNTVILKPALPALIVAHRYIKILHQAGFPEHVCQLLPGRGEVIGDFLVQHPDVAIIAFTGSREIGLRILEKAHSIASSQKHIKQIVCEMGGKNAIIVDEDADLDEAVIHILASAFAYQGQKCSAASRLIIVGKHHDRLVTRLSEALDNYSLGPSHDPKHIVGPVISKAALQKAQQYIEIGKKEGELFYQCLLPDLNGYYVPPTIFTDILPHHRLAQEEIFAPILSVLKAPNFHSALDMALDSDYALTGGVFSRLPEHLDLARERYRVGNLYLNRKITGALVGVQPFGGFKLSGTGIQAGGEDYLKQFMWSRVVTENTLRHGFVPADKKR